MILHVCCSVVLSSLSKSTKSERFLTSYLDFCFDFGVLDSRLVRLEKLWVAVRQQLCGAWMVVRALASHLPRGRPVFPLALLIDAGPGVPRLTSAIHHAQSYMLDACFPMNLNSEAFLRGSMPCPRMP